MDIMEGNIPKDEDFWCDHVMFDITETMMGAVNNAPSNCKAMTFHEYAFNFPAFVHFCKDRGMQMVMAKNETFERVWM